MHCSGMLAGQLGAGCSTSGRALPRASASWQLAGRGWRRGARPLRLPQAGPNGSAPNSANPAGGAGHAQQCLNGEARSAKEYAEIQVGGGLRKGLRGVLNNWCALQTGGRRLVHRAPPG